MGNEFYLMSLIMEGEKNWTRLFWEKYCVIMRQCCTVRLVSSHMGYLEPLTQRSDLTLKCDASETQSHQGWTSLVGSLNISGIIVYKKDISAKIHLRETVVNVTSSPTGCRQEMVWWRLVLVNLCSAAGASGDRDSRVEIISVLSPF